MIDVERTPPQNANAAITRLIANPLVIAATLLLSTFSYPPATLAEQSAQVDIYGRADLSVDYYQGGQDYSAFDMANNSSRLGLRAKHALDTGMELLGEIEQGIDLNLGGGAEWASRSALIGLKDEWGKLELGYMNTLLKELRSDADLFSSHVGDSRNVLRGPHNPHLDDRMRRSIRYTSPEQLGWGVGLQYSFDTEADNEQYQTPADDNQFDAYSALLRYVGERFWLAFGRERFSGTAGEGLAERRAGEGYRFAAAAEITDKLTLYALAQTTEEAYPYFNFEANNNTPPEGYIDALGGSVGILYQLADDIELRSQYSAIDPDRSGYGARMGAIGTIFHADDRTRFYTTFAHINNQRHSCLAPWVQGRTAGPDTEEWKDDHPANRGCTAWAISSGIRFDF